MRNTLSVITIVFLVLLLSVTAVRAQSGNGEVYWHFDPSVKECSMVIDPSLTQTQWHEFTKQVGAMSAFKSLASAQTLGTLNVRFGFDCGSTPVDQRSLTWINTFTHPDGDCPLGDVIKIPALRGSVGFSDNIDIGASWTTAPNANYGFLAGEFKYAFMQETEQYPAAALRGSVTLLTGVADFDLNIYSIELLASKQIAMFTPYAGFRTSLVVGTETTSKVSLKRESIPIAQGYVGVTSSLWVFTVAAEYNVSSVNTFAFAVGVNFQAGVNHVPVKK